jgi:hypothetical protein
VGEGAAREHGVAGEVPNLAARLQGLAGPGAVVADAATRRITGALFAWADLGTAERKGFPRPVRAWRALGEGQVESRFEALRAGAGLPPLVGRGEELELLLRLWRRARAGEGQVVLLGGEAGIGKSRLTAACVVPGSRGASLTREGEDALWQQVFMAQPERRRVLEPSSKGRKRAPAPWPPATG